MAGAGLCAQKDAITKLLHPMKLVGKPTCVGVPERHWTHTGLGIHYSGVKNEQIHINLQAICWWRKNIFMLPVWFSHWGRLACCVPDALLTWYTLLYGCWCCCPASGPNGSWLIMVPDHLLKISECVLTLSFLFSSLLSHTVFSTWLFSVILLMVR